MLLRCCVPRSRTAPSSQLHLHLPAASVGGLPVAPLQGMVATLVITLPSVYEASWVPARARACMSPSGCLAAGPTAWDDSAGSSARPPQHRCIGSAAVTQAHNLPLAQGGELHVRHQGQQLSFFSGGSPAAASRCTFAAFFAGALSCRDGCMHHGGCTMSMCTAGCPSI